MSEKTGDTLYWTDVYLKNQEEFFRRWNQMASGAAAAMPGAATANPFAPQGGWPNWGPMFGAQMPGPAADVAQKYFGLYEQYMGATRALWESMTQAMTQADPAQRGTAFVQQLQGMQAQFAQSWQSMFAPQGKAVGATGATPPAGTLSWPSMDLPALGLTRERQQALQKLQHLVGEYWQQQAALTQLWNEVIGDAFKRLGEVMGARLQKGDVPQTPKALYDLWVESGEAAYAVMAHSPRYAKAQADLGNTLAKLRTQQREIIESVSRELDLPTRAELNTVHRRLKDMKAEIRQLRAELDRAKPPRTNGARAAKPRTDLPN